MAGIKLGNILLLTSIVLFGVSPVFAQELEPRKYTNLPVGLNFVGVAYAYTAGGALFDPTIPLDNANIRIQPFYPQTRTRYFKSIWEYWCFHMHRN